MIITNFKKFNEEKNLKNILVGGALAASTLACDPGNTLSSVKSYTKEVFESDQEELERLESSLQLTFESFFWTQDALDFYYKNKDTENSERSQLAYGIVDKKNLNNFLNQYKQSAESINILKDMILKQKEEMGIEVSNDDKDRVKIPVKYVYVPDRYGIYRDKNK